MVQVKWLGVAGLEIRSGDSVLLIDPYISRPSTFQTLFTHLKPETEQIDRYIESIQGNLAGILVGHTHSDHVLDIPWIVKQTGTSAYGSQSLARLFSAYDLLDRAVGVAWDQAIDLGPFKVTPIESIHGRAILGRIPLPGEIETGLRPPMRVMKYRHGGPIAWHIEVEGKKILHLGSADLIDENVAPYDVDTLFVCSAGRQSTPNFSDRLLGATEPSVVVPFHFDNFLKPLVPGEKVLHLHGVDLDGFVKDLKTTRPSVDVRIPAPYTVMEL
jgi:L-ascorbate metabolism protein UlaG (beta-lactamase superfamily)